MGHQARTQMGALGGQWLQDSGVSRVILIEESVKMVSPTLKYSLFFLVHYCTICRSDGVILRFWGPYSDLIAL